MKFLLYGIGAWIIFTVFVTVFAASADRREVRLIPKPLWVLICLFIPLFGGLLYLTLGRPVDEPKPIQPTTRTVAPDDDPEFLRDLAKKLREEGEQDAGPNV